MVTATTQFIAEHCTKLADDSSETILHPFKSESQVINLRFQSFNTLKKGISVINVPNEP